MYALVNEMNQVGTDSLGTVISRHRTIAAADRADTRLQRAIMRSNGLGSYLPTIIVELVGPVHGRHVPPSSARRLTESEIYGLG